ncbi:hypothetical protein AWB82_05941 [Caballeronia glebae]|uniref:Uncharacterized protein n=1 Tax=Caballeronia glebae TaxID=1777143 RepID=A0A158CXM7_9BURK|nr:hypothetical protein [Caballeronia glebae]SAK86991.1 hypothetical protein AWB82_05941 [Caballeronia glebae]
MGFDFGKWRPSYNTLDVPLNIGWQCTLVPRHQCGTEFWFLKKDARKTVDEDRIAFDRYFRPNLDLRTVGGGTALRTTQRFLQVFLNVAHWKQPASNEEIERFFRKAVRDGELIPVVDRGWRLSPRFDVPSDAPQRWPKQVDFQYAPRDPDYIPISQRGAVASGGAAGKGTGGVTAKMSGANSFAGSTGGGAGGSSSFDWLGAVEDAAGAVLGGSSSDDDSLLAMNFGDESTSLGKASPFEFESGNLLDRTEDVAGVFLTPAEEARCELEYELDMAECSAYAAMDKGYWATCKERAMQRYSNCLRGRFTG